MVKRQRRGRLQTSLFVGLTTTMAREPAMIAAIVDALAELLLEAARPNRGALRSAGGQDDESQDHG
jgi:hypothetical protein